MVQVRRALNCSILPIASNYCSRVHTIQIDEAIDSTKALNHQRAGSGLAMDTEEAVVVFLPL